MAELRVERRRGRMLPWLIGALVIAALLWLGWSLLASGEGDADDPVVIDTVAPPVP